MTELHSSDLNFHLVPPTDKSSGVSYILDNLLNYLNQNEFNVHAKVIGRLTKTPFVHISHQFWQNHTELTYAPSFYLVAKVNCDELLNLNTLNLQLAAYNGKLLQIFSEQYPVDNSTIFGNLLQRSQLLGWFLRGEIRLCNGLLKNSTQNQSGDPEILQETIGERTISRSRLCQYAVIRNNTNLLNNHQICNECKILFPSNENHEVKEEIIISDDEGEDEEEDDIMENEEFLAKDDVRVVSITNGLPEKLGKLSGISIKKIDEEITPIIKTPPKNVPQTRQRKSMKATTKISEQPSPLHEPQVNLTVFVKGGGKAKALDFTDFRKDLNIEKERQTIREPVLSKKRKKIPPISTEISSGNSSNEKRLKKLQPPSSNPSSSTTTNKQSSSTQKPPSTVSLKREQQKATKHCPVCNKPFTDITEFMTHLNSCNSENNSDDNDDDDILNDGGATDLFDNNSDDNADDDQDYKPPLTTFKTPSTTTSDLLNENGLAKTMEAATAAFKQGKLKKLKKPPKPTVPSPECTICMTVFKHEASFPKHMKAHEDKIDINAPMLCPVCSIEVESRKLLNPHIKEHHPEKGGCCIECEEFMSVNFLKSHLSRKHHHAPEREGQLCPICGKKCYYTADLEIHIAVQHMGLALERPPKDEGEVMCHECGKVFSHRYRLKQHLSTTHNKSRDHPCPFCAKVFCLKHQLTKHLLTHADVKPFKCKYCDYQNVRKYRVTKHCQKQHRVKGTDEDIETMHGADKPSEFVHNVFGL